MSGNGLSRAIAEANARYRAMTPEQQIAMLVAQRRSWVRGNLMLDNPEMTLKEADALIREAERRITPHQEEKL